MNRRQFLLLGTALPVALVATPAVIARQRHYDLPALQAELARLPLNLHNPGSWNLSQMLQHCAQSVRYSLDGYPRPFSSLFQHTAGRAAATVFRAAGAMRHDLNEAIPGAAALDASLPVTQARDLLLQALADFQRYDGPLKPHFAYGALDKEAYAAAHWLHVRNHLDALIRA